MESTFVADEAHESRMAGAGWDYRECPDASDVAEEARSLAMAERDWAASAGPYVPRTPWGPGHPDFKEPPW